MARGHQVPAGLRQKDAADPVGQFHFVEVADAGVPLDGHGGGGRAEDRFQRAGLQRRKDIGDVDRNGGNAAGGEQFDHMGESRPQTLVARSSSRLKGLHAVA
jgi:hypothetical protein